MMMDEALTVMVFITFSSCMESDCLWELNVLRLTGDNLQPK